MKALTVCQPYAELIVSGAKPIENRSWPTRYRGELAIHAGKSRDWLEADDLREFPDMAFGAIVGVARLVGSPELSRVSDWRPEWLHLAGHEHANGPFCWILESIERLARPVPCRGAQGLWTLGPDDVAAVRAQTGSRCDF
jgi:hypothetical protein